MSATAELERRFMALVDEAAQRMTPQEFARARQKVQDIIRRGKERKDTEA